MPDYGLDFYAPQTLLTNDGCQIFSTTFYTPLEADGMDKLAELPQDYVFLNYLRCHDDIGWRA